VVLRSSEIVLSHEPFQIESMARPAIPPDISANAEEFLQKTFEIDHEARPSVAELLQHPWLAQ
jgi:mitogen-activated protein kinase kinase kinase